jgi:hypothetical protein
VLTTIIGLFLAYLAIRKPRWRKYRCRGLPYDTLFRGEEYGYNSKTFLRDVTSVDTALKGLRTWYTKGTKPLLFKGVTGVGKSRLATEFIGRLNWRYRLWRKVLVPTPHELSEMLPPIFTRRCVLFLNDLHEFRDIVPDAKMKFFKARNSRFSQLFQRRSMTRAGRYCPSSFGKKCLLDFGQPQKEEDWPIPRR